MVVEQLCVFPYALYGRAGIHYGGWICDEAAHFVDCKFEFNSHPCVFLY